MATFNDNDVQTSAGGTTPSYGITKTSAPFTRVTVRFADGYEQRVVIWFSLNIKILKYYNLKV